MTPQIVYEKGRHWIARVKDGTYGGWKVIRELTPLEHENHERGKQAERARKQHARVRKYIEANYHLSPRRYAEVFGRRKVAA